MRASIVVVLACAVALATAPAAAAAPPLPTRWAAIGDSTTRVFDVCSLWGAPPSHSWSTGGASGDGVASHYERIAARTPAIAGHASNDALSGARMGDATRQAL